MTKLIVVFINFAKLPKMTMMMMMLLMMMMMMMMMMAVVMMECNKTSDNSERYVKKHLRYKFCDMVLYSLIDTKSRI